MKKLELFANEHNLCFSYELGRLYANQSLSISDARRIAKKPPIAKTITLPHCMTFYVEREVVHEVEYEEPCEEREPISCQFWGSGRNVLVFESYGLAIYDLAIDSDFDPAKLEMAPQIISINGCQWYGMNARYDNQEFQIRKPGKPRGGVGIFEQEPELLYFIDENGFQVDLGWY